MGRAVVSTAKEAFGPLPDTIPGELLPNASKNVLNNTTLEGGNGGFER